MKVTIDGLDHYGRGVVRKDKIIFVENALPKEIVEIKKNKEKKKYIEAETISIEKESKDRCKPNCPYYKECGGCNLLHMRYEKTLSFKENKVKEIMNKFFDKNIKINPIIHSEIPWNYRNKATFHVDKKIGYYKKNSNDIIKIGKCNIVDESINEILNILQTIKLDNIYEIVVRASKYTKDKMVILKVNNNINEEKIIEVLKDNVTSISIYKNKKYKTIYGDNKIIEKMNKFKFQISEDSFFQVNTDTAIKLYKKVLEYLKPNENDNVLDLYCGTGTIGIFISEYVNKVTGIEINESAIKNALENARLNNITNISFICKDSSKAVLDLKNEYDKIIVDPPRAGLDKNTINFLNKSNAKMIVYVSCDPVTLARDLKLLSDTYSVLEITPVDMFPHTHHVECVCSLEKIMNNKK